MITALPVFISYAFIGGRNNSELQRFKEVINLIFILRFLSNSQ